jgi:hypothetical protein
LTPNIIHSPGVAKLFISCGFGAFCIFIFEVPVLTTIGISVFVWATLSFTYYQTDAVPIRTLFLFMATLQWSMAPLLFYYGAYDHYKYGMYVPEYEYMQLSSVSVLSLAIGLFLFRPKGEMLSLEAAIEEMRSFLSVNKNMPFILLATGILFSISSSVLPRSLGFAWFLLSNLTYVGVIQLLFSTHRYRNVAAFSTLVVTFLIAASRGLFHDFFLWTIFVGIFYAYSIRLSGHRKIVYLLLAIFFLFLIQTVKAEYRDLTWQGNQEASASLYVELIINKLDSVFDADQQLDVESSAVRLNQGWIVSRIMEIVPAKVPFQDGKTIWIAIKAAILPRFLFPDKPKAGGKENFEKFTQYTLSRTSMGISLLGEGYVNYGTSGAPVFLFIFGLFISMLLSAIVRISRQYPLLITFLPVMFFHVIKAETDLINVLNFLTKSSILMIVVAMLFINIFSIRLSTKIKH